MSSVTNKSENPPEDPRPNALLFGLPPSVFPGLFMLHFGITRSFSRQMAHPSFEDLELSVFFANDIAETRAHGVAVSDDSCLFVFDEHTRVNGRRSPAARPPLQLKGSPTVACPLGLSLGNVLSRKYLGRNIKCGSPRAPWRSPFREVGWENSVDGAISYPSENPGLGFLLLIPTQPLPLHLPRLLRMYV